MKKDRKELPPEVLSRLSIGQRIRHERQLRYMTQAQLSELLGISVSYLGALERGDRPVSSSMILRFHECLGLSYDYLLEGTSFSDLALAQYIKESDTYGPKHNLEVMLGTCSPQEMENCYDFIHTYLMTSRRRKRHSSKSCGSNSPQSESSSP